MGQTNSRYHYSDNDYELVIKASKELEHLLETEFGATGRGLQEKISSVASQLPNPLIRQMRNLASIRNRLIHENGFDRIPDRHSFIHNFEASGNQLRQIIQSRRPPQRQSEPCALM